MRTLTVGSHSDSNAFLEAAFLALVPRDFVDYAFPLVFTCIGRVQVLLDRAPEETLGKSESINITYSGLARL